MSGQKHRFYFLENGKRYLLDGGKWRLVSDTGPSKRVNLISDVLPDVRHPSTGKVYSSKSRYYADTRAMGKEIMGNDMGPIDKPRPSARSKMEHVGYTLARNYDKLIGGR